MLSACCVANIELTALPRGDFIYSSQQPYEIEISIAIAQFRKLRVIKVQYWMPVCAEALSHFHLSFPLKESVLADYFYPVSIDYLHVPVYKLP